MKRNLVKAAAIAGLTIGLSLSVAVPASAAPKDKGGSTDSSWDATRWAATRWAATRWAGNGWN